MNLKPILLYIGHKSSPQEKESGGTTTQLVISRRSPLSKITKDDENVATACEHILTSAKTIIANIAEVRQRGSVAKVSHQPNTANTTHYGRS